MKSKGYTTKMLTALAICALFQAGCIRESSSAGGKISAANPLPAEISIKQRLLLAAPETAAEPLKLERQITSKPDEGGVFVSPVSLAFSAERGIYVSDNNGHAIHYCPPGLGPPSTLPPLSGPGDLRAPSKIYFWQDKLFVNDREGIKVFEKDGSFQRLLRVYYGIFHYAIAPDGAIYINPYFAEPKASQPLIVKLNAEGARVSRFGARINHPTHNGQDDRMFLSATDDLLIAAAWRRPVVQIYDRAKEELIREFRIEHPIFGDLEPLGNDPKFVNPRPGVTALPRFTAGLRVIDGRIFVLLHLPKAEIVEFDLEGREKGRYRLDGLPIAINYFGLDVCRVENDYRFSIGVIDADYVATLAEFTLAERR